MKILGTQRKGGDVVVKKQLCIRCDEKVPATSRIYMVAPGRVRLVASCYSLFSLFKRSKSEFWSMEQIA